MTKNQRKEDDIKPTPHMTTPSRDSKTSEHGKGHISRPAKNKGNKK